MDTENVKEHKGIDPENKDVSNRADKMVIVANMDVQKYSLFSWEKNVSLIEGEFPTYKNKGIIVEPVSYTHLDVYKRQYLKEVADFCEQNSMTLDRKPGKGMKPCFSDAQIGKILDVAGRKSAAVSQKKRQNYISSVSYTHLRVWIYRLLCL